MTEQTATFQLIRKSLGRRIAETLDLRGYKFTTGVDALGRLTYTVEVTPDSHMTLLPGEMAEWMGIPLMDSGR